MSVFNMTLDRYPTDGVATETSITQDATETLLSSMLTLSPPPPLLQKSLHTQYLAKHIFSLPAPYMALDASRPWLLYWCLHSLDVLGVALDQGTKDRAVNTILSFQHPSGGFCGSPGQAPHLLPTYASIMSLAILSQPSSFAKINVPGLYNFYMSCKKSDGSFIVCDGGEVDVRGIYCLLVGATMTGCMTEELVDGVDKFIASCQTFEGGFASSAFPLSSTVSAALSESHGGYTSCALFSHFLLRPIVGPSVAPINVSACLRWAVQMQGLPTELGGFRGRTNKLVDGCYGWWVGGLFAVLDRLESDKADFELDEEAPGWAMHGDEAQQKAYQLGKERKVQRKREKAELGGDDDDQWEEVDVEERMLFNRVALQEFVLVAAQSDLQGQITKGGLRDKPGKSPDLYHTCNNLSGLSSAQHLVQHSALVVAQNKKRYIPNDLPDFLQGKNNGLSKEDVESKRKSIYANALGWKEDESGFYSLGGDDNKVNTTSPVFNVLLLRMQPFLDYFYGQKKTD